MRTTARHFFAAATALCMTTGLFSAFPAFARTPDDSYFQDQWYLKKINAPAAWDSTLGFEGIPIAIIDSGVDIDHPDLKDNIWRNVNEIAGNGIDDDGNGYVDDVHGWDFVAGDNDPSPDVSGDFSVIGANHGTIDAGIAAGRGNNGRGIAGVSWQATIMPIRALDSNGTGDPVNVVRAVEYAVHNGAKIINLSFAGPSYNPELAIALRRAYDAGVFVVAAAGNAPDGGDATDLDRHPLYPVCFDQDSTENFVYGVAATDENDKLPAFSNYGAGCIDISAPGSHMLSTQLHIAGSKQFGAPYGGYFNGTSLAAAEVSGLVALLRALDYNLTPKQIMNILTDSAVKIDAANPGFFGKLGRGRIDAAAAVQRVLALHKPVEAVVSTASLLPPGKADRLVVAAAGPGRAPEVRLFTPDGSFVRSFLAFPTGFTGGVNVATADFDRTAHKTIVAGAGAGGAPQVRIFDFNTRVIGGFLAYDERFTGGVSVAAADVDGDGRDEIVTGAGRGGGPHVRIFQPNGRAIGGFFAFDQKSRAGVAVAAGDLDGDGKAEIVTAAPGGLNVKVWNGKGKLLASFETAAPVKSLALSDVDRDGKDDIVVGAAGKTGAVAVAYAADGKRVGDFDAATFLPSGLATQGAPRLSPSRLAFGALRGSAPLVTVSAGNSGFAFQAFESSFKGGVSSAIAE